jgi:tyrosyl-tRNA synthetase
MTVNTDANKIHEFLHRGVEIVLPTREFVKEKLEKGDVIKVYLGIDPTGPTLHIGHAIAIRKLAQLQALGHKIILLAGDFTARIGDPTDKTAARTVLTAEQVAENLKNYKAQASKILKFDGENPAEFVLNSTWLSKMSFADVLELASKVTVQQMLERDMFQKRAEEGKPIYIHEFMYPLMQVEIVLSLWWMVKLEEMIKCSICSWVAICLKSKEKINLCFQ